MPFSVIAPNSGVGSVPQGEASGLELSEFFQSCLHLHQQACLLYPLLVLTALLIHWACGYSVP